MNNEQSQRVIHLDPEIVLRLKYIGVPKRTIAAYFGMRYADFIHNIKEQPMLRELLK